MWALPAIPWLAPTALAAPFLPLESIAYRVDVSGPLARVEVVERFRNTSAGLVDAVYVFPLAPGAALDGLHVRIGTREIDGTVRARAEARATYEAARAEGRTAALTEEVGGRVFTQDVANLPPGEAIEVTFSVVQPVERRGDEWHLTVPLLAPPRFLPLGRPTVLAALAAESARDVGVRATVDLTVQAGASVRDLWAAPLPRDVRPDLLGSAARLSLDELPLVADLDVGWRTARDAPAAGLLLSDTHLLLIAEPGLGGDVPGRAVDWGRCAVRSVDAASVGGTTWFLAERAGPCVGPVVVRGGARDVWAWPRPAADPRTLATSWARAEATRLAGQPDAVRALGLRYGIVTPETSFVAVDTGGPVHVDARPETSPWPVSALSPSVDDGVGWLDDGKRKAKESVEIALDEEEAWAGEEASTTRGEVVTREFLQRIPTGRSYQSAVQSAPGVLAGSGGNPNLAGGAADENAYVLDGVDVSEPVSEMLEITAVRRGDDGDGPWTTPTLALRPPSRPSGLTGAVGARGAPAGAPLPGGGATAALGGPIVADRLWWTIEGAADRRAPPLLGLVDTASVSTALTAAPGPGSSIVAHGAWSGGASELAGGFGAGFGQARARLGPGRHADAAAAVTVARATLGDAASDRVSGALEVRGSAGDHAFGAGVELGDWTQRDAFDGAERVFSSARASEAWSTRLLRLGGEVAVAQAGPVVALAPTASVAVGPRDDVELVLAGGRRVDLERLAPTPGAPVPSTVEGTATLRLGPAADGLSLAGAYARESGPFVAPLALDPLPDAPLLVDRAVSAVSLAWTRLEKRRWSGGFVLTFRPALAPVPLAADPTAPFVPGYLDAARRWAFAARVGWRLPTDPVTLALALSGRVASAVDPDGPWWTRAPATLGLDLEQSVPVRGATAHLRLGVAVTRHDLGRAALPLPVLIAAPEALQVADDAALRATAGLDLTF